MALLVASTRADHMRLQVLVAPDTGTHIAGASGKRSSGGTGRDGDDAVLVALQHEMCDAGTGIPELYTAILAPGQDPRSVWGEGHGENKVL